MKTAHFLIKNAVVVDGSGLPRFKGSVRVQDDQIVEVARDDEASSTETDAEIVDAGGLVLAPGFIDAHTHYDAQLLWDKLATPAAEHGSTTIITGCCSLSLAPVRAATKSCINGIFKKTEDLDLSQFPAVDFAWESFPDFLDRIKDGLGVNVSPMIGHTPLRHYVMGEDAQKRVATDDEIERMSAIVREGIRAGVSGVSISYLDTDENNVPIASRWADKRERTALARAMADAGRGVLQGNINLAPDGAPEDELEELAQISLETGIHVEMLGAIVNPDVPDLHRRLLAKVEEVQQRGADVVLQTLANPFFSYLNFSENYFQFYILPVWSDVMAKSVPARAELFRDPDTRRALHGSLVKHNRLKRFLNAEVVEGFTDETIVLQGQRVIEIAAERGQPFFDTLLDIALTDDLRTRFALGAVSHCDPEGVIEVLNHPFTRAGNASDGGAHVSQFSTSGDSSYLLSHWVRDHKAMPLERAVQLLTSIPAREFGIKQRGEIRVGNFADLVIFDPDKIAPGPLVREFDLPNGLPGYINHAIGVQKVFVNGVLLVDEGSYTDARVGRLV